MANSYVILSNTGALGGGYKIAVIGGSWKRTKPAYDHFTGLDGDSAISVGAANSKWVWEFVAYVNITPVSGYCSLAQLETYITSMVAAERSLKFQDVYNVAFDVISVGGYDPMPVAWDTYGSLEPYEVSMKLVQR